MKNIKEIEKVDKSSKVSDKKQASSRFHKQVQGIFFSQNVWGILRKIKLVSIRLLLFPKGILPLNELQNVDFMDTIL